MAPKTRPFSVRLSPHLDEYLSETAKRTRRSKAAVLEALAEEGIRSRRFPGIGFRGEDWDRDAWMTDTGWDVWEIIEALQSFGSIERLAADSNLEPHHIRLAVAYHQAFPEEIDTAIAENNRSLEEWRALYPEIDVILPDDRP